MLQFFKILYSYLKIILIGFYILSFIFIFLLLFGINSGIFNCILKKKHLGCLITFLWIKFVISIVIIIIIIYIIYLTHLISTANDSSIKIIVNWFTFAMILINELSVIWLVSEMKKRK